jgi:hypothetical protein
MPMMRYVCAAAGLVAVCGLWLARPGGSRARVEPPPDQGLTGTWEVASVHRDGALDPAQVGGLLRFEGNEVSFESKKPPVLAIADGTS